MKKYNTKQIRNIAIIAHVDHGKTTLIDGMLKQTQTFRHNQAEMSQTAILDQNDLEKEKGITILAKNTAVFYHAQDGVDYKINIIDTPGHADFSGEVERVINMADGALLIVDAAEGPLAQTKFVLEQAIKQNLKLIVLVNKIDRRDAEPNRVLTEIEDMFLNLVNTEDQLNFPVLYGIGKQGQVWTQAEFNQVFEDKSSLSTKINQLPATNLQSLFEQIIKTVPAPTVEQSAPFKMLVSNLDFDNYKGAYAIGKVSSGTIKKDQSIVILEHNKRIKQTRASYILTSHGLDRVEINQCQPGDIIAIAGIEDINIGQTIAELQVDQGFPVIKISEPTVKIRIAPNSSPFVGRESQFCTARQLENRLNQEQKTNLGLSIEKKQGGGFLVSGRGELHLAVLIENMRRQGYEMEVGKPEVIIKTGENGEKLEPVEELYIEINQDYLGIISEELGKRHAELKKSFTNQKNISKLTYEVPSKNLFGFRSDILTKTRGNGLFNSRFIGYKAYRPYEVKLRNGVLIASESGVSTAYALESLQQRGVTFVDPGEQIYEGMIIGLGKTQEDIEMNACKTKKLTNFRSNAEVMTVLSPAREMSLEQSLDFIEADELVEVTPQNIRLRKKYLTRKERVKRLKEVN